MILNNHECLPRIREVLVLVISEEKHSINNDTLKSDASRMFSVDTTSILLSLIRVALKMLTVALRRGGAKLRGMFCSVLSIGL